MTNALSITTVATVITENIDALSDDAKVLLESFLLSIGQEYVEYATATPDTLMTGAIQIRVTSFGDLKKVRKQLSHLLTELTFEPSCNQHDISVTLKEDGFVTTERMVVCSWQKTHSRFGPVTVIEGSPLAKPHTRRRAVEGAAEVLFQEGEAAYLKHIRDSIPEYGNVVSLLGRSPSCNTASATSNSSSSVSTFE